MSGAVGLLLGLLLLSYLGNVLSGKRTIQGFGLPSGTEYLVLGFVLGPLLLGVVERSLLEQFQPMMVVGAAWLALVAGVGYTPSERKRYARGIFGVLLTALVATGVAASVFFALSMFADLDAIDRVLVALGAGSVCSATTRHSSRWIADRYEARGELSSLLSDFARASALIPALLLAVLFAAAPDHGLVVLSIPARAGITIGIGVVLGVTVTLLLGREFRRNESWGLLLGTALLGTGITVRLGLSSVTAMFALGVTISAMSPHRAEIREMLTPTEKPVLLPVAVLAGAAVYPASASLVVVLGVSALGARLVLELVRGSLLCLVLREARPAGPLVGLGMVTTGGYTLAAAVELNARLANSWGPTLLTLAAIGAVLGELIGPTMLRRALLRTGDITESLPPAEKPSLDAQPSLADDLSTPQRESAP